MPTPNVQLAFQGGGAKLAAMLPVAGAFLKAQNAGLVNITAVSGTSAGAICAALVACRADFTRTITFLQDDGQQWSEAMVPKAVRPFMANGSVKFDWWTILANRRALIDILLNGKAVLDCKELKEFLKTLLEKGETLPTALVNDGRTTMLTIIASNLVKSEAVIHRSGNLLDALTDSCSLPVIFRSFSDLPHSHVVDGGICDNLPVEVLLGNPEPAIFAIYPVEQGKDAVPITNLLSYLLSIISVSINHGVTRSIKMVSKAFRFEVKTNLGLLQFAEAVALLKQPGWYETERDKAFSRIRNFSTTYGQLSGSHQARVIDVVDVNQYEKALTGISDDFAAYIEVLRASFIVRVKCDLHLAMNSTEEREADVITRVTQFRVRGDKVDYYRTSLSVSGDTVVPTVWSARNKTRNRDVPIRAIPLGLADSISRGAQHCLIQFIDPGKNMERNDVIDITGVYHSMPDQDMRALNARQNDFFGFDNVQLPMIAEAEIVLIYPIQIGPLQLIAHEKCNRADVTALAFDDNDRRWIGPGFDAIGVAVKNLATGQGLFSGITRV